MDTAYRAELDPTQTGGAREGAGHPLAMDIAEFRRLGYRAVDIAAEHLAGLRRHPVFSPMDPGERQALRGAALPDQGVSPDALLTQVHDSILSHPMGNGDPRFFGWVNSPPAPIGVLADLLAAALNPSCAGGDHSAIYVEHCAVRWIMELVGFPTQGSAGLLVSGGSMASLTGLAAARHHAALAAGWNERAEGMQGGHLRLVLYMSEEGHSCMRKAAELLGLGSGAIHVIPTDAELRMNVDALRVAIAADRQAGLRPFCVAASAGTVNSGTIDPLDALADLCETEDLWLHVDGAYGAVGILDATVAPRFAGLERADSLAVDPHKWLSVPVECGCALIRDGALLRDTFSLVPPYLRTEEGQGFGGPPWFSEFGFQQSRGFRALKLWMTLQYAGRDGLAALVTRHNALARYLASRIEAAPDLELLLQPELSIVLFRYTPARLRNDEAALDAINKEIVTSIQADGEVFITGTTLRGRSVLRACIIHYGTDESDLDALITDVLATARRITEDSEAAR